MGRRVIAIVIALAVALFGTIGVVAYAQGADSRAVAGQQTQRVYIAKTEVPAGTTAVEAVAQKMIVVQPVVARGVPEGALKNAGTLAAGLVATSTIMAGEIVLTSRFGAVSTQTQSRAVPDGMVAVTINLADRNRIAPLLTPGAHVVIYDTFNARDPKAASMLPNGEHLRDKPEYVHVTKVVLNDVQIIAVGDVTTVPTPKPTSDGNQQGPATLISKALVTVAVTPAQAVTLVQAIQTGELYAALRGADVKVDPLAVSSDNTVVK